MPHICVSELVIIDSGNGLAPVRRQAITITNAALLSVGLMETNFSEIGIGILFEFIQENAFGNVVCPNGGHFVDGKMS